jgi:hypothetical protein
MFVRAIVGTIEWRRIPCRVRCKAFFKQQGFFKKEMGREGKGSEGNGRKNVV